MNTTLNVRAGRNTAQEIVQTVLLIILSSFATWIALYSVPWRVSEDPCLVALVATVVLVICLLLTRWPGLSPVSFARSFRAVFLVGMPLVYVARYLIVSTGRARNYWL